MPNSGILHALPNLVMLFNCLAFPKVTTFACSFGAFDVNVSVFNMSFSGADVRGLGLVRAAEEADRHGWSILSRQSVIFSACHSFFDPSGLINEPRVFPAGWAIAVLAEEMLLLSKDSLSKPQAQSKRKQDTKHLIPSFFLSSLKFRITPLFLCGLTFQNVPVLQSSRVLCGAYLL